MKNQSEQIEAPEIKSSARRQKPAQAASPEKDLTDAARFEAVGGNRELYELLFDFPAMD